MALEFLRSVGHGEITAASDVLAAIVPPSASIIFTGLALLGQIGYLFELLLGIATAAIGIVGVFRCSRRITSDSGTARIDEQSN